MPSSISEKTSSAMPQTSSQGMLGGDVNCSTPDETTSAVGDTVVVGIEVAVGSMVGDTASAAGARVAALPATAGTGVGPAGTDDAVGRAAYALAVPSDALLFIAPGVTG